MVFTQIGNQRTVVKPEPGAKDQGHWQDGWSAVALGVLSHLRMAGRAEGQRLQLQSDGSSTGKLWQQGPSPGGFFRSQGLMGQHS